MKVKNIKRNQYNLIYLNYEINKAYKKWLRLCEAYTQTLKFLL